MKMNEVLGENSQRHPHGHRNLPLTRAMRLNAQEVVPTAGKLSAAIQGSKSGLTNANPITRGIFESLPERS
jgi:hypothetical protein